MGASRTATVVDVRDMLCAQALAAVARTLARLRPGDGVGVRYNAEDVKQDVRVWAKDRGHAVTVAGPEMLRIEKG